MSAPSAPIVGGWPTCLQTSIQFWWQPPATGAPLEKYTLACSSISYSQDLSGDVTNYTVTGLTAGTEYEFTLTATNATGTGPALAFPKVGTGLVPFGPTVATASTFNASTALVSWTPSTIANQAPLKGYLVTAIPVTAGASTLYKSEYAYRTSTFIKGISTNTTYQFLVYGVAAPGYCIPFAYTSTLGFGTTVAFSPSSLTGMALWLDANSSNNFTLTGSNITTWIDRSANAYTATKAGSPSLILSTSAVHFASGSYLGIPDAAPLRLQANSFSIYGVYRTVPTGQTQFLMSKFVDGGSYDGWNLRAAQHGGGSVRPVWYAGGTPDYVITSTPIVDGSYRTLSMYQYYSTLQTFVDGGIESTIQTTTPTNATVPLNIGVRQTDGSSPFNGSVREIIMYSNAIIPFDRQKVEGYLAWKWGLNANLPTTHPFKTAAPTSASVFSPSSFSGLSLWLDATKITGYTNGQGMTSWIDASPNAFSNAGSNGPTFQTNALNAQPVVRFNGSTQFFNFGNVLNLGTTGISIFSVASYSNTGAGSIIAKSVYGPGLGRWALHRNSNPEIDFLLANSSNTGGVSDAVYSDSATGPRLHGATWDRSNLYLYSNATQRATVAAVDAGNSSNAYSLYVGAYGNGAGTGPQTSGPNLMFNGDIAETLVFNRALSRDDRQTVEGYLAWKWGLQGNLPTTHPYKFLSPASNYAGAVVPQGLLVNFTATAYSGSGTWSNTASLGTNNDATVENGTPSKNGAGNGVVFNGATNFTFSNVAVGNAWTASLWLKRTGSNDAGACYLTQLLSGSILNLGIYTNFTATGATAGSNDVAGGFFNSTWRTTTALTTTTNTWYNLTYTWNGTTLIMYVAGSSNAAATPGISASDGGTAYRIGRRWDSASYIRGEIGQILIYNRALTAAEVAQNYAATSNTFSV